MAMAVVKEEKMAKLKWEQMFPTRS